MNALKLSCPLLAAFALAHPGQLRADPPTVTTVKNH